MEIDLHAIKRVIQGHLSCKVLGAIPQTQGEEPQVSTGREMGRNYPSPQPARNWGAS